MELEFTAAVGSWSFEIVPDGKMTVGLRAWVQSPGGNPDEVKVGD